MARAKKPLELRPVDESPAVRQGVPRLGSDPQPVRLVPENKDTRQAPAARLVVPDVAVMENRRSHEPGVEVLIDPEETTVLAAEEEWSKAAEQRGPVAWGWFVLVGLLLAAAAIWAVSYVRQAEPLVQEEHKQAEGVVKESVENDQALQRMIEAMEQRVKAFCEAGTIEAMLPLVRQPARTRALMEGFYAQTPLQALGFKRVKNFQGAMLGGLSDFWVFTVVVGDGGTRSVLLEQEPSGNLGVDWETAVTYQPMKWDDYARQRPAGTTMEFRVHVKEDHFFSHEFADAGRWASYSLTTIGAEETLFGYAPKGGAVEASLHELVEKNEGNPAPAILRLCLPDGIQSRRGVIIEKLVSPRWIYVEPPDSGS